MARYSMVKIRKFLIKGQTANDTAAKGKALEELIAYVFEKVAGIIITKKNQMNLFNTEEVDVAFWNDRKPNSFDFLPNIILIECKNWSTPVGGEEVSYFCNKVRLKGLDFGIFVALNGITGDPAEHTNANFHISMALKDKIRIIVITGLEIERLVDTNELISLIKRKLCSLTLLSGATTED